MDLRLKESCSRRQVMKKFLLIGAAVVLSGALASSAWAADATVTGHLRDSFCLLTMGAFGPSHHNCAVECAKAGIPVLLVQNKTNKYYVLMPSKDKQSLPADLTSKMEEQVTVSGSEYTKGGMTFLTVESVK
ncbi:MAG: hypothetical protein ACREQE_00490 [Candidatus Binataceae bacterium]